MIVLLLALILVSPEPLISMVLKSHKQLPQLCFLHKADDEGSSVTVVVGNVGGIVGAAHVVWVIGNVTDVEGAVEEDATVV